MKKCESYRIFKKIVRKYYKRHNKRTIGIIRGKRFTSYWTCWNIWCYYLLKDEDYNDSKITKELKFEMSLSEIQPYINQIKPLIGKKVEIYNTYGEGLGNGTFKGLALVNFGIMVVLEYKNKYEFYFTNVDIKEHEG